MALDPKRLALLYALSDIAMLNAEELLRHIAVNKISADDPAYPGLVTGVVVNYARPFGQNRGLGSLPDEFRIVGHFELTDLQPVHQYVIDMRNKLFAHFDLSQFSNLTKGVTGLRPPDEVELEFMERGFHVTTNELRPPLEFLHLTSTLIFVQRTRISKALFEHMSSWLGTFPEKGRYKLSGDGINPI
jgi:hypothetical protein